MRRKLLTVLAVAGMALVGTTTTAQAGHVQRAAMDITLVAAPPELGGLIVDGELVSYVGTLTFRGEPYKIAYFAPLGPPPAETGWVTFDDRWAIYEFDSIDFFDDAGALQDDFDDAVVVREADERGIGNFPLNKFFAAGPGGFWYGSFVDGTPQFVGTFWLFGSL